MNVPEADGTTALHWAVRADDVDTARLLVGAGANANAANRYGVTPLSLAAANANAAMVELLLDAGADANATLRDGETILMAAARTGNPDAVALILSHGADVNAREQSLGETALMWAAAENHPEAVKLLVDRGADVNARSSNMAWPKIRFGLEGVLTILPHGRWTPLMYAARQGSLGAARTLADAGASLNLIDPDGTTAMVVAIINGHYDVAAMLAEKGADPNIADTAGMAALYAAVDMNTLGEVYGRPARKSTSQVSALDLMKVLLAHGADPNAQLKSNALQRAHTPGEPLLGERTTPLMRAAKNGDFRRDPAAARPRRRSGARATQPHDRADVCGGPGPRAGRVHQGHRHRARHARGRQGARRARRRRQRVQRQRADRDALRRPGVRRHRPLPRRARREARSA